MKITITPDGYICDTLEKPIEGRKYILEDAEHHSGQQRKAAHALINEWYKSGLWDFIDTMDYNRFRDAVKYRYGAGMSHLEYVENDYTMHRVVSMDEVPEHVVTDFNDGNHGRIKGVLKSFADYKKSEVKDLIDKLLIAMDDAGVCSPKYEDIKRGMSDEGNQVQSMGY